MLAADAHRLESLHVCTWPRSQAAAALAGLTSMAPGHPMPTSLAKHMAPLPGLTRLHFQVHPKMLSACRFSGV